MKTSLFFDENSQATGWLCISSHWVIAWIIAIIAGSVIFPLLSWLLGSFLIQSVSLSIVSWPIPRTILCYLNSAKRLSCSSCPCHSLWFLCMTSRWIGCIHWSWQLSPFIYLSFIPTLVPSIIALQNRPIIWLVFAQFRAFYLESHYTRPFSLKNVTRHLTCL